MGGFSIQPFSTPQISGHTPSNTFYASPDPFNTGYGGGVADNNLFALSP